MPNKLMESASGAVYGVLARIIAIAVFFCVTAGQAAAITLTGYYKNATLQTLAIGVTGDSFEFGGCSMTVSGVAPNISGSVSTTSCVSTGAQMFAMRTDGVSARFCYKMSTASLADAATKACSNDPATQNGSRSPLSYATIYVVIEEVILSCPSQRFFVVSCGI